MTGANQWIHIGLRFAVLFCWFFSLMVAITSLESHNQIEIILKGIVAGIGGWCGWGLLKRRQHVILFTIGLCFYALFGSVAWLYNSTIIPILYGQEINMGWYDALAMMYIICAAIVIKLLLSKSVKQIFTR